MTFFATVLDAVDRADRGAAVLLNDESHAGGVRCVAGDGATGRDRPHDNKDQPICPATQAGTPASAASSACRIAPPACARSVRPPPPPPTCSATWLTSSPAPEAVGHVGGDAGDQPHLPSSTVASTTAAVQLVLSWSMVSRSVLASAPVEARSQHAHAGDLDCLRRGSPPAQALASFAGCSISRSGPARSTSPRTLGLDAAGIAAHQCHRSP